MGHKYLRTSLSFPKHCQCNSFLACLTTQIKPVLTTPEAKTDRRRSGWGIKQNNHTESSRERHMFASMLKRAFKFKHHIDRGNAAAPTYTLAELFSAL